MRTNKEKGEETRAKPRPKQDRRRNGGKEERMTDEQKAAIKDRKEGDTCFAVMLLHCSQCLRYGNSNDGNRGGGEGCGKKETKEA